MRGTPNGLIFKRCVYQNLTWLAEKWPEGYILPGDPRRTLSHSTIASMARQQLIEADEQKPGRGRWKRWRLTDFGREMVKDYKDWLADTPPQGRNEGYVISTRVVPAKPDIPSQDSNSMGYVVSKRLVPAPRSE